MAKKAKEGTEGEQPTKEKGGKGKTLPAVILAVAILGAAYMVGPGGKSAPAAAGAEVSTTTTTKLGSVASLDPITLNLADGRYLKVAIALQLSAEAKTAAGGKGSGDTDAHWARALDAAISVLGSHTYDELAAPGGRDEVKAALSEKVSSLYEHEVVGVYFTEFVMQ
ncbi:MAG TPA: flagellar basal body-associated FliL family protein [Acidimicrobiales bacterium]|nr:flagellar basal body-associated FliL family protein [Acidimicrobiales bacterium]